MPNVATVTAKKQNIARPLKILVPLIQDELQQGNSAGREHYRHAGELLIEAKEQVTHGRWGSWLSKNFDLSTRTAQHYMQWAREMRTGVSHLTSMREMRGATERDREDRTSTQQQKFRRELRDVARDDFAQERQQRNDELKLHRELAMQLID